MPKSHLDEAIAQTEAHIARLQDVLEKLRAAKAATETVLTGSGRGVNTTSMAMANEHKLSISKKRRRKGDKFGTAIEDAGYSYNTLAATLGISTAALSRYGTGDRKIPRPTADKIASLTKGKWPADKAHWPQGISEPA